MKSKNGNRQGNSGESLVQVLVVLGILGIVMSGFLSMTLFQQNEAKALSEKIGALETSRIITSTLANSLACNNFLSPANVVGGASSLTFDASLVTPASPNVIDINSVAGLTPGVPTSSLSQSLVINGSQGIQLSITSPTTADLLIKFDSSKLVRAIKMLSFPLQLQSTGPANSTTITGCNGTWTQDSGIVSINSKKLTYTTAAPFQTSNNGVNAYFTVPILPHSKNQHFTVSVIGQFSCMPVCANQIRIMHNGPGGGLIAYNQAAGSGVGWVYLSTSGIFVSPANTVGDSYTVALEAGNGATLNFLAPNVPMIISQAISGD